MNQEKNWKLSHYFSIQSHFFLFEYLQLKFPAILFPWGIEFFQKLSYYIISSFASNSGFENSGFCSSMQVILPNLNELALGFDTTEPNRAYSMTFDTIYKNEIFLFPYNKGTQRFPIESLECLAKSFTKFCSKNMNRLSLYIQAYFKKSFH